MIDLRCRLVCCFTLVLSFAAVAAEPATPSGFGDDVGDLIAEAVRLAAKPLLLVGDGAIAASVSDWRAELKADTGLEFSADYTLIMQASTAGMTDNDLAVGTMNVNALWTAWDHEADSESGQLGVQFRHRALYTDGGTRNFRRSLGTTFDVNDDDSRSQDELRELWWRQWLFGGHVRLDIGKLHVRDLIDRNAFAQSSARDFLAEPIVDPTSRTLPGPGLGAAVRYDSLADWYITGVLADGTSDSSRSPFHSIDDGDWFAASELGYRTGAEAGRGNYRVTWWYRDLGRADTQGVALSFDQHLDQAHALFMRLGVNDARVAGARSSLSGGLAFTQPFGRIDDRAGVGLAWVNPADNVNGDEYLLESYYRIRVTQNVKLTPDVQVIFQPAGRADDTIVVLGLRLRVTF